MLAMSDAPPLREKFLAGMASAAATVSVVTTDGLAGRFGTTVSAMSSVSADGERPTLLVCVHHASPLAAAIIANRVFCVNVLRDDQSYISDCFAGRFKTADGDKFSCAEWVRETTGAPRVVDPLVAFDCQLVTEMRVGTHHVFFGEVADLFLSVPGSPLIYANRAYGTPARHGSRPISAAPARSLRIGAFHTFGPFVIPEVVERMTRSGEALDLQLLEGDQRRLVEALQAGEIDGALLYDLDLVDTLGKEHLVALPPYVLLASDHPLAARSAVSLSDLAAEPMILLDAPPSGAYFTGLFTAAGLTPTVRLRTQSIEMVRGFVGHGLGYSLLATKPAAPMSYDGRPLTMRPLADTVPPSRIVFAYRQSGLPPAARAFRDACRDLFVGAQAVLH
jgi:flavin reductase (DIM6/NTAB) family NADH-FMN oxidoreductase RutF/DNA-binding transcriptional LysR family regulator